MGKRGRGYGAVYWRPDGRWEGQIRIPGGGRRSFYARTRRDVIHRLAEARWAVGQGLPVSAGTTSLATFFGRWLTITGNRLRPSTVRAYRCSATRALSRSGSAAVTESGHDRVDLRVALGTPACRPGAWSKRTVSCILPLSRRCIGESSAGTPRNS